MSRLALLALLVVGAACGGDADGDTDGPQEEWSFLDLDPEAGINRDPTTPAYRARVLSFDGALYATWQEGEAVDQIRVARYDEPDWTFVDGNDNNTGLNLDWLQSSNSPVLASHDGRLYAAWEEGKGIRVAVMDGETWLFVDGEGIDGVNAGSPGPSYFPSLASAGGRLYIAWSERDRTRVAAYNGNDAAPSWTLIDGGDAQGLNRNDLDSTWAPSLCVFDGALYALWAEEAPQGGPDSFASLRTQVRVALFGGDVQAPSWTYLDGDGYGGLNLDNATGLAYTGSYAQNPVATVAHGKLYVMWEEKRYNSTVGQIHAVVFGGDPSNPEWTQVMGQDVDALNHAAASVARFPSMTDVDGTLYATWSETLDLETRVRVARYSGDDSAPGWTFVDGDGDDGLQRLVGWDASFPSLTSHDGKLIVAYTEEGRLRVARRNWIP